MISANLKCMSSECKESSEGVNSTGKFMFQFEAQFDPKVAKIWAGRNWTIGFYLVVVYVIVIFGLQNWMRSRARFPLQRSLIMWNLLLAGFSILGAVRVIPESFGLLNMESGWHRFVCSPTIEASPIIKLWGFLFALSKAPELGDTFFIVLRKQPLIFLHWYHHVTVLLYSWYSYVQYTSTSRCFMVMNFSVHAFMYSYYLLRALKFRVPRPVALAITILQILQMVIGLGIICYALGTKVTGSECSVPFDNLFWGLAIYGSYFQLFVNFFQKAYLCKDAELVGLKQENIKME